MTCTGAKFPAIPTKKPSAPRGKFHTNSEDCHHLSKVHLLASDIIGAVHAFVPFRTFVSTVTIAISAFKFDIHTGAASLPAGGTIGVAIEPDRRLDEAGYKKRAGDCRECFHFTAVNLRPELARKQQYGHEDNWHEQLSQGFVASERSIPPSIVQYIIRFPAYK